MSFNLYLKATKRGIPGNVNGHFGGALLGMTSGSACFRYLG